ncbi:unnamed protein product [Choristocarpus tenellus]
MSELTEGREGSQGTVVELSGCPLAVRSAVHTLIPAWGNRGGLKAKEEGREGIEAVVGERWESDKQGLARDGQRTADRAAPTTSRATGTMSGSGSGPKFSSGLGLGLGVERPCTPELCGPVGVDIGSVKTLVLWPRTFPTSRSGKELDGKAVEEDAVLLHAEQKEKGLGMLQTELWGLGDSWGWEQAAEWRYGRGAGGASLVGLEHYLAGRGGTRGVSVTHLTNHHVNATASVVLLLPVPYSMAPLLSTLRGQLVLSDDISPLKEGEDLEGWIEGDERGEKRKSEASDLSLAGNLTLAAGRVQWGGRRAPAVLEGIVNVPPGHTLIVGFDFFKRFLPLDHFPPDPSRGLDIPSPMARFVFNTPLREETMWEQETSPGVSARVGRTDGSSEPDLNHRVLYVHGEACLLDSPQPDFSMPFNVITITSTAITFFLGTAINLFVRKTARKKRLHSSNGNVGVIGSRDEGVEEKRGRWAWRIQRKNVEGKGEGVSGEEDGSRSEDLKCEAGRWNLLPQVFGEVAGRLDLRRKDVGVGEGRATIKLKNE